MSDAGWFILFGLLLIITGAAINSMLVISLGLGAAAGALFQDEANQEEEP